MCLIYDLWFIYKPYPLLSIKRARILYLGLRRVAKEWAWFDTIILNQLYFSLGWWSYTHDLWQITNKLFLLTPACTLHKFANVWRMHPHANYCVHMRICTFLDFLSLHILNFKKNATCRRTSAPKRPAHMDAPAHTFLKLFLHHVAHKSKHTI